MSPVEKLEDLEGNCNTNSVGEPEDRIFFHLFGSKSIQKVLLSEKVREAIRESCDVPKEYKNSASKTIDCLKSSTKSFGSSWSIYDYKNYGCYWMFDKIGFIKTASLSNTEITHYSKILQGTSSDLRRKSEGLVATKESNDQNFFSYKFPNLINKCYQAKNIYDYKNYGCYWRFDKIGFIKTASLANIGIIHYCKILQGTPFNFNWLKESPVLWFFHHSIGVSYLLNLLTGRQVTLLIFNHTIL
ncbi:hypothetical protein HZH66_015480 [Vespula vulgaris]|uniref:Uncharacterized protein n=1 Tax=Vespula vulgaris TaxID=7454 RepID=A0A834MQ15_VESVU|nr:hypothetical protein HZH66_015480 [Vespula vulgaris]